jgi:hypothetical protein
MPDLVAAGRCWVGFQTDGRNAPTVSGHLLEQRKHNLGALLERDHDGLLVRYSEKWQQRH